MKRRLLAVLVVTAAVVGAGCGSKKSDNTCDLATRSGCGNGTACEAVQGGSTTVGQCFQPVQVQGTVTNLSSGAALAGARVVALDPNRSPLSTVGVSANTTGAYSLTVRADRDATGKPVANTVTLRADALGFQSFPGGIRTALPIDLSSATQDAANHPWIISSPLTAVKLLPVSVGTAFIRGSVALPPTHGGVLVVAEPASAPGTAGVTAVADDAGAFEIDNLASGTAYTVSAYTQGSSYTPVTTSNLNAGENDIAPIALSSAPTASFSGGLIFNNSPPSSTVTVSLVLESTYVASLDRGESPPGLSVVGDSNGYSFSGVPDGQYRVLAAYPVDGDVRDISGGGNTDSPMVTISGGVATTPPNFKIIPAVTLVTIGGQAVGPNPTIVTTATPVFEWGNAPSQAHTYRVLVYDASGTQVWTFDQASSSASATFDSDASATGPLQPNAYYQLRIVAIDKAPPLTGSYSILSQTEDPLGVFVYQP